MVQINFPNNYVQCVFDCGVRGCSAYTNSQLLEALKELEGYICV